MKGIIPGTNVGNKYQPNFFNAAYGRPSVSLTGTSVLVISTTQAAFHGMAIVTTSGESCTVTVYDSISGTTGNIVGHIFVTGATGTQWDLNVPTLSRNGLVAVKTGTGSQATVFYGPKG